MQDTSPTARALLALELVQNSPGISGDRLGARLGVSDRAARRYVGILREAGIPVESTPGRFGGYRIGRGFRVPPLMFSTAEALGLVMAALEGRPGGPDGDDPVSTALNKIIRVLPAAAAEPAGALRQVHTPRTEADTPTTPNAHTTAVLARSCADGRRVRLGYDLGRGTEHDMEVDPWAVSIRRGRWYLLCWSHSRDARRVLRVDRITRVEVLAESFVPPPDLDAVRAVEEHFAEGWRYAVEVLIDAPLAEAEQMVQRHLGRLEAVDPGRTRLVGSTDDPVYYVHHLMGIPAPFHIVAPAELRETAADLGRRLLDAAYSPKTAPGEGASPGPGAVAQRIPR